MGLAAVGNHKLAGVLPVRHIFNASLALGSLVSRINARPAAHPHVVSPPAAPEAADSV
jgi:hypothetical protein